MLKFYIDSSGSQGVGIAIWDTKHRIVFPLVATKFEPKASELSALASNNTLAWG
jgi:hypothetical protein